MTGITDTVEQVDAAFLYILGTSLVLLTLVTGLMIYFAIRFRRSRNPEPSDIRGNWLLETVWTNAEGYYAFDDLDNGSYGLDFYYEGCDEAEDGVTIANCEDVTYNQELDCECDAAVYGTVYDQDEEPLNDVLVKIWHGEEVIGTTYTGIEGWYEYDGLEDGSYAISFHLEGCDVEDGPFTISDCEDVEYNQVPWDGSWGSTVMSHVQKRMFSWDRSIQVWPPSVL